MKAKTSEYIQICHIAILIVKFPKCSSGAHDPIQKPASSKVPESQLDFRRPSWSFRNKQRKWLQRVQQFRWSRPLKGNGPPQPRRFHYLQPLELYSVPSIFDNALGNKLKKLLAVDNKHSPCITREEAIKQHATDRSEFLRLQTDLLFAEEVQCKVDMLEYDQENSLLKLDQKQLFRLDVPGLAEKRPSLIRGDSVGLMLNSVLHEGKIWFVNLDHILLKLHHSVPLKDHICSQVHFTINRTPFRLMHRALQSGPQFLTYEPPIGLEMPISLHNRANLSFHPNSEQERAASAILAGSSTPILVWGPPGFVVNIPCG